MCSDPCLDGCSSVDGLEGQNQRLESDSGRNRKPVEVAEENLGRTLTTYNSDASAPGNCSCFLSNEKELKVQMRSD